MIKVNLKYNNDLIESVSITGHAGFDDFGNQAVTDHIFFGKFDDFDIFNIANDFDGVGKARRHATR